MTLEPRFRPMVRRLALGAAVSLTLAAGGLMALGPVARAADMASGHMAGHGGMHAMMQGHIERMLAAADATPEQKARIEAIFRAAHGEMTTLHQRMEAAHGQMHRLLTAPTLDREAIEQARAAHIADADRASRVLTKAMVDAAEVLSPEQRAKLAAAMAKEHAQH